MAKVIMIQGTMSNVGKSLVCAGLCRVFMQDGLRAVPFKSQNMALNSYITDEGLEMGRAQVMQAEAAGVLPSVLMNPVLLKPTSDMGSQVIVNGTPIGTMKASEYFKYKHNLIPDIMDSFNRLAENADVIVIEGAGSPAEINLKSEDIVNMGMAEMVDAPVLLVGDIDRGGVFAQLVGTLELLNEDEKKRIKGLIINKFRGDVSILKPGIDMLVEKVGIPVIGTLPYTHLTIDDEDSLSERLDKNDRGIIDIVVIRLPRMSNFSDFMCFEQIPEVSVRYASSPKEIVGADMVILPGTKNTIADLRWLRESGIEAAVIKYSREGIVFGICGGYQMLGTNISDPYHVEEGGSIRGMGLLPIDTVLTQDKTRTQVNGRIQSIGGPLSSLSGLNICGYEIHMGESRIDNEAKTLLTLIDISGQAQTDSAYPHNKYDGLWNANVYGSYVHGFFDNEDITTGIVRCLAARKGIDISVNTDSSFEDFKQKQYDILADMIRNNMDMDLVYKVLGDCK